ncbi:MAG: DUF2924 domain-containing protein [Phycisphaerales bacterium]|nr:DUF2924 domain-containing protein [Phycisphaerales bacterium]
MTAQATPSTLEERLAALESLTVAQLRERYKQVFGEDSRSGNRQWLYRRVAWRMQALAEGDLSERARKRAAELARDADVRVRAPSVPTSPPRVATSRRFAVTGTLDKVADRRLPPPGTVLCRTFKGEEHRVTILTEGFEYGGRTFRSLTAVATAITGSHWNGFLFFGLAAKE